MKKTDLVVTSNQYVEAKYLLGLNEEKIIYCAMLTAREIKSGFDQDTFIEVRAKDFAMLTGLDDREAYRALRRVSSTLKKRFVTFHEPDPVTGKPSILEVVLVNAVRYVEEAGVIRLRFTKEIIPHFTQLIDGNFTVHEIGYLAKLSSTYATRLYRLLHKEMFRGKVVEFDLEYLRDIFQLEGKYQLLENFKKRVVDIAVAQINEHTELKVSYESIKMGRTVTGLGFTVTQKPTEQPSKAASKQQKQSESAPQNLSAFTGLEKQIFNQLQRDFDFIDEEYVRQMMGKWGIDDAIAVMHKLREEMSPDNFSLEKSD
jgi:plasmid replication initiation protein